MFADEEEQSEPHQEANERVHGLVADRAQENMRADAGHAQRGDQQEPGPRVEDAQRRGAPALHRRGGAPAPAAHARVPRLQVPAAQEAHQARPARRRRRQEQAQAARRLQQQPGAGQEALPARAAQRGQRARGARAARAARLPRRRARLARVRLLLRGQRAAAPGPHGPVLHHGPAAAGAGRGRGGPGRAHHGHGVVRDGVVVVRLALRVLVHARRVRHAERDRRRQRLGRPHVLLLPQFVLERCAGRQ